MKEKYPDLYKDDVDVKYDPNTGGLKVIKMNEGKEDKKDGEQENKGFLGGLFNAANSEDEKKDSKK